MNIHLHLDKIIGCKNFLYENRHTGDYIVLINALTHFIDNLEEIVPYIPDECHFAMHFAKLFEKQNIELDDCFTLQEDLVMIFRAKILQVGKKNMHTAELKLLKSFEDNLKPEDYASLSATWYFLKLPVLVNKSAHTKNYAGRAWQKWWKSQMQHI